MNKQATILVYFSAYVESFYSGPPHQQRSEVASRIQSPSHVR